MTEAPAFSIRDFLVAFARSALFTAAIFVALCVFLWLVFGTQVSSFGLGRGGGGGSHHSGPVPLAGTAMGISFISGVQGWLAAYRQFIGFPQKQWFLLLGAIVVTAIANLVSFVFALFEGTGSGDPLLWLSSIGGLFVGSLMGLYWLSMWSWGRDEEDDDASGDRADHKE